MDILAKKLSVISAIIAMLVVAAAGLISGVYWESVMIRSAASFFAVLLAGIVLFRLALKDRPGDQGREDNKKQE